MGVGYLWFAVQKWLHNSILQFYNLKNIALSGYDYVKAENGSITPIQVILTQYNLVELNTAERTYTLDGTHNDS